jgi:hypothetical protein
LSERVLAAPEMRVVRMNMPVAEEDWRLRVAHLHLGHRHAEK